MTDIEEAIARGHQASNLFPMLGDAEVWELADDIGKRGLLEPIVIHEGQILDGRNRWVACVRAGRTPRTVLWDGEGGSPTAFVISKNLKRRHLVPGQRAAIAAEALPMFEAEAKERQRLAGASAAPGRPAEKEAAIVPDVSHGEAREFAARQFEVSPRYVQDAKRIKEADEEAFERVKAGAVSIPEAKRELGLTPPPPEPDEDAATLGELLSADVELPSPRLTPIQRGVFALGRVHVLTQYEPAAMAAAALEAESLAGDPEFVRRHLEKMRELPIWVNAYATELDRLTSGTRLRVVAAGER